MEKKTYSEKLKDPRWQKIRLEVFERDAWTCQNCFDAESTLCVHHLRYIPGWEPWEYPLSLLMTLCEACHAEEYEAMPDSIDDLVEQIKDKGFLASDVHEIAVGFNQLSICHLHDVIASAIRFALSHDAVMGMLIDMYFKALAEQKNV